MDSSKKDFLRMINKHQSIINSLCHAYYHDVDDQKDTKQDIILQLWRSFASFRGGSDVSTWVYRVSLNTIFSKYRKERKLPYRESLEPSHENEPAYWISADDDVQFLHQIIESLKDLDKAIVILYLDGYKNKEIADIMGLTSTNISTRMNRIKRELRSKFRVDHEFK